jgi:hypothetical protein
MSPTSYQTAPPREVMITTPLRTVKQAELELSCDSNILPEEFASHDAIDEQGGTPQRQETNCFRFGARKCAGAQDTPRPSWSIAFASAAKPYASQRPIIREHQVLLGVSGQ